MSISTGCARSFLPGEADLPRFINADLTAAALAPFAPEAAAIKVGRLMLDEIAQCAARGESFAFETTLSGLSYLRHIKQWRGQGYQVSLFFLSLPDAETAIARVAERVRQGGHDIPEAVIRRRFVAGRDNFERQYRAAVDDWTLYDNAGSSPVVLEWGESPRNRIYPRPKPRSTRLACRDETSGGIGAQDSRANRHSHRCRQRRQAAAYPCCAVVRTGRGIRLQAPNSTPSFAKRRSRSDRREIALGRAVSR